MTEMPKTEDRRRLLVEGAKSYAMILLDTEGRIQNWNTGAECIMEWTEDEVAGQSADFIFTPEDRAADMPALELQTAAAEGRAMDLRWHMKKDGTRFFADEVLEALRAETGELTGFVKVLRDATEEGKRRERERFLADLTERARGFTGPDDVIADAVRSTGRFLGVARCVFVDIDIEADICTCQPDYRADDLVISMAGTFPISSFGEIVVAAYGAGQAVAVDDVRLDRDQVPEGSVAAYDALSIRAHVGVPVVHSSRLVSCIGVHSAVPRNWKREEVELLQAVVERTWLTVEVLRQQQALAREAEELRVAHRRTTGILESITDGFIALDHDWRFTYINDQGERITFQKREEVLGRVFWDVFPQALGTIFERQYRRAAEERVVVTFEEYFAPLNGWFEIRAYPSDGGLSLFFQNVNERKALEAERERLAGRERNIARQLQAALTPEVPGRIPGMALAKHYEAALAEAGVGGDFYDVFPVDKGCTALVVGDLSGKGLAAASQVATVRNMLRYALYRARTLAGALGGLNALLAEQGLLAGFATLFVGAYDSSANTLTYVNCGQEPALVRRAGDGSVEPLAPTGPVLGSFDGALFEERTVKLAPGDALAVFTDGITEVGQSRTQMLGIEGVSDLFAAAVTADRVKANAGAMTDHLARRLIAGIDQAASGGLTRDDVCLLVAVVE